MQLMLDTANLEQIRNAMELGFIDGVTTNPSILSKEISGSSDCSIRKDANSLFSHLDKLRSLLGSDRSLHVQVTAPDCQTMVEEGRLITKRLGIGNTYVKVPANVEGVKAMKILHSEGYKVTGTAVNSVMQGLLASYAGADYVAIYYSNMIANGIDAMAVTQVLNSRFSTDLSHTKMLAASFKNPQDVSDCYAMGTECCTLPYDVLMDCLNCPASLKHTSRFANNWSTVFGAPYTDLIKEL